jgi:hypothetical protein
MVFGVVANVGATCGFGSPVREYENGRLELNRVYWLLNQLPLFLL